MQLTLQVVISGLIVLAVLWFMWRIPRKNDTFFTWAPPLAFMSPWAGLAALIGSATLWALSANHADQTVVILFLGLDPGAIATGVLVLWIYRDYESDEKTIQMQRTQAWTGIALGIAAVVVGYIFVMTHKTPFTPVGP